MDDDMRDSENNASEMVMMMDGVVHDYMIEGSYFRFDPGPFFLNRLCLLAPVPRAVCTSVNYSHHIIP
jgi:hypothetical protein